MLSSLLAAETSECAWAIWTTTETCPFHTRRMNGADRESRSSCAHATKTDVLTQFLPGYVVRLFAVWIVSSRITVIELIFSIRRVFVDATRREMTRRFSTTFGEPLSDESQRYVNEVRSKITQPISAMVHSSTKPSLEDAVNIVSTKSASESGELFSSTPTSTYSDLCCPPNDFTKKRRTSSKPQPSRWTTTSVFAKHST